MNDTIHLKPMLNENVFRLKLNPYKLKQYAPILYDYVHIDTNVTKFSIPIRLYSGLLDVGVQNEFFFFKLEC
jgi:hypothetical protein